jgi:hypothetical protein
MPKIEWKNNPTTQAYEERAKNLLKGELKRRGLAEIGIAENERNLNNKISRGGFTAAFLIQCLEAIGCHTVRLGDG